MPETSAKASTKKGFTAPVLKDVMKKLNLDKNKKNNRISEKSKKIKHETSLSDSQYEDIFSAVLSVQKSNSDSQHIAEEKMHFSEIQNENTPSNKVQEGGEKQAMSDKILPPATPANQQKREDTKTPPSSRKSLSQLSPWGSHFNKQSSQGSSILKELREWQNSLQPTRMSSDSSSTSDEEVDSREEGEEELPQQPSCRQLSQVHGSGSQAGEVTTDQRRRLEELQRHRNVGVWVYCCRQSCQKQRYLANITDPQDVPDIWYCHNNPDTKYNNCQYDEQKLSAEEEDDMIYNQFTAGSLVWARVDGYPWWPAMVDDDPDLEQYYWLDDDFMTVTSYHVVFFDETSVTRAWVNLKNISSYSKSGIKYKQRVARGIDYSRRIEVAKEQADDAVGLSTAQRLQIYSFIARYKGPIATSTSQVKKTMTKYKLKVKTVKKSSKQVDSQKEKREKYVAVKDKNKSKEEKKASVKNTDETHCSNSRSGNKNYEETKRFGKRKKNEDEGDCNKKSKKAKTMFDKKVDSLISKKTKKEKVKIKVKSDESHLKSTINSSFTENKLKKKKKQKDFSKVDTVNGKKGKKSIVESFSPQNNKFMGQIEDPSEKGDSKTLKEVEKIIEETVVDDTEKDNEDLKNPLIISKTPTDKDSRQHSTLATFDEEDVTNFEGKKLTRERQTESETPSGLECNLNLSQKSKSSDRRNLPGPCVPLKDDILIPPSQESKHSQRTVADLFTVDLEDAVVPDSDILSQLSSQPFEE